jgi:hypothetical protein
MRTAAIRWDSTYGTVEGKKATENHTTFYRPSHLHCCFGCFFLSVRELIFQIMPISLNVNCNLGREDTEEKHVALSS